MHKKKEWVEWSETLSGELNQQAQKSFQLGLFEEITDAALMKMAPETMKSLNHLLQCANLLLNHARENMTMLNRINHSGMWSMYFGENSQINRVVYTDEFREISRTVFS